MALFYMSDACTHSAHSAINCVVTGGASGIGRAIAIELLRCGATVVAVDRNPSGLQKLAEDQLAAI